MGRPKQQESITTFAEVINRSNSYPHQSNRVNNNDNRLMIYFQGLKLYIPDDFQPDTLLKLLQTMKRFAADADHIFLACGATDFRKQIPGLVASVTLQFQLDPYNGNYVFIFPLPEWRFPKKRICGFLSPDSRDTEVGLFNDQLKLSHTLGMALRNAAHKKNFDYSKRMGFDLFQQV